MLDDDLRSILAHVDSLPPETVDDLADALKDGPFRDVGEAFRQPYSARQPNVRLDRGLYPFLLLHTALGRLARHPDADVIADELLAAPGGLWRMLGEALREAIDAADEIEIASDEPH